VSASRSMLAVLAVAVIWSASPTWAGDPPPSDASAPRDGSAPSQKPETSAPAPAPAPSSSPATGPAAQDTRPAAVTSSTVPEACEASSYLLASEASLARVADAVKISKRLDILVVGSASSLLAVPDGAKASYPARLEAALREKLSGISVNVTTVIQVKKTAEEVAQGLAKLAKERKPTLIIWQTGTVDALRSVDPDDFRAAIDNGLTALADAGTDVVLMNLQYSPRMENMISVTPYVDNMRVSAEEHNVPLFDRFAMMRDWNESGRIDLSNPSHSFALAKQVHDCLGQTLAAFIVDTAHVPAQEPRIQH
jgi:hypothetical protein